MQTLDRGRGLASSICRPTSSLIERAAAIVELAPFCRHPDHFGDRRVRSARDWRPLWDWSANYANAGTFAGYKAEQILRGKEGGQEHSHRDPAALHAAGEIWTTGRASWGVYPPLEPDSRSPSCSKTRMPAIAFRGARKRDRCLDQSAPNVASVRSARPTLRRWSLPRTGPGIGVSLWSRDGAIAVDHDCRPWCW